MPEGHFGSSIPGGSTGRTSKKVPKNLGSTMTTGISGFFSRYAKSIGE